MVCNGKRTGVESREVPWGNGRFQTFVGEWDPVERVPTGEEVDPSLVGTAFHRVPDLPKAHRSLNRPPQPFLTRNGPAHGASSAGVWTASTGISSNSPAVHAADRFAVAARISATNSTGASPALFPQSGFPRT